MRPFHVLTTVAVLAFGLGPVLAEDPKKPNPPAPPGEKPPAEKPADKDAVRGYLGFKPEAVPLMAPDALMGLRITALSGVVVLTVTPNAPAAKAGLKPGDMLLKLAGKDMPDTKSLNTQDGMAHKRFSDAFMKLVEDIKPGAEVEFVVKRSGEELVLKATAIDKATLEKIEKQNKDGPETPKDPAPVPTPEAADRGYVGFEARSVAGMKAKAKKRWKVKAETGIVAVHVLKGSPAQKAGLANGDVLVKYAGVPFPTAKELEEAKDARDLVASTFAKINAGLKTGAEVEIVVERDGKPVTLKAVAVDRAAMDKITEASGDDDDDEEEEEDEKPEGGEKSPAK